jgi:hypothetical protein
MWVIHTPSGDQGIYLESVDNDQIKVWSKAQKTVCTWNNCDLEVILDSKDSDEFTELLRMMVSKRGKETFDHHSLMPSCLDAIQFYIKEESLAFETFDARLQTLQEVLYFAIGDKLELSEDRDRIMLFIHGILPNMMIGALVGYKLGKARPSDESDDDSAYSDELDDDTQPLAPKSEPPRRKRWGFCC